MPKSSQKMQKELRKLLYELRINFPKKMPKMEKKNKIPNEFSQNYVE